MAVKSLVAHLVISESILKDKKLKLLLNQQSCHEDEFTFVIGRLIG